MKKLFLLLSYALSLSAYSADNFNTLDSSGVQASTQSGTWTVQPGNTANTTPWLVTPGGNVASGATDSGNPVKIGGVYNSTQPTLTTGQRGDMQIGTRGSLAVTLFGQNSAASAALVTFNSDTTPTTTVGLASASIGHGLGLSSTYERFRTSVIAPSATLTGFQNSLPWAIYNATPTTRTEAQGGPLQSDTAGSLHVVSKASSGTITDRSGTITLGGTAQTIMSANTARRYLLIQNSSDTVMWCNFTTTAVASQPSFTLIAGASFVMENNAVSTEAISCIGATTGKIFTAKEM